MPPKHPLRRLLLTAGLLALALPAWAEYHWNPFDHLTQAEAGADFYGFLLLAVLALTLSFVVGPVLLGLLTYAVLQRWRPAAQVRLRPVLLGACLATVLAPLLMYPVAAFSYTLAQLTGIAAPVVGAACSYFRQLKRTPPATAPAPAPAAP